MRFACVGEFCPNESCSEYGKLQSNEQRNIKKAGKTKGGHQRYQCKSCKQTFTETKGTIFYRRRTSEEEILETLGFIAEGVRISSLARVKGHKEDMADYQLEQGQLDALWSHVGNKGEKRAILKPTRRESSGEPR
jgi:hypothetical protein